MEQEHGRSVRKGEQKDHTKTAGDKRRDDTLEKGEGIGRFIGENRARLQNVSFQPARNGKKGAWGSSEIRG